MTDALTEMDNPERPCGVDFIGSKPGRGLLNEYNYTDLPAKLLFWDLFNVFRYAWSLPLVLRPLRPRNGNHFDELARSWRNAYCVLAHGVLVAMQLAFVLSLPLAFFVPPWITTLFVAAFWAVTLLLARTLNGSRLTFMSDPKYSAGKQSYDDEKWLYLNGISICDHWLKTNLDRLALTFGRPVLGIHNRTYGIIFDLLECIAQRTFGYATKDIRLCYVEVKKALVNRKINKVVFILHSQGGIEGGMIVDWLLQELPQNLLSKLEVYTFGNAANHFNNPYRNVTAQAEAEKKPLAAAVDAALIAAAPASPPPAEKPRGTATANKARAAGGRGQSARGLAASETQSTDPSGASGNAIGHIEHYCHSTDFVALWGVLHFKRNSPGDEGAPVFAGRAFSRTGPRGHEGHLLCQHYLNAMFPLERSKDTGDLVGCAETNDFMEGEVIVGSKEDAVLNGQGICGGEAASMTRKVKDLSRLWLYRNGKRPGERQSSLCLD